MKMKIKFNREDKNSPRNGIGYYSKKVVLPSRPIPLGEEWEVELIDKGRYYSAQLVNRIEWTHILQADKKGMLEVYVKSGDIEVSRSLVSAIFVRDTVHSSQIQHDYEYNEKLYSWFSKNPSYVSEGQIILQRLINRCGNAQAAREYCQDVESQYIALIVDKKAIRINDFDDVIVKIIDDGDDVYERHYSLKYDDAIESASNKLRAFEQSHVDFFRLQELYMGETIKILEDLI